MEENRSYLPGGRAASGAHEALLMSALWALFLGAMVAAGAAGSIFAAAALGLGFVAAGIGLVRLSPGDTAFRRLVVLLVGMSLLRVFVSASGTVDLSGDEAFYWEWSRRLDLSYYSKPPGVAYAIRLGTAVFGDTALGVRAPAAALLFASGLLMYKLGSQLHSRKAGAWAAAVMQITPLFAAYGIGMTPDTLLIFFWVLALVVFQRARSTGKPASWLVLGAALGLGLLGKLAVLFFYIPAVIVLLGTSEGRRHLRSPWPYAAFAVSFIFLTPQFIWNARHDWVYLRHEAVHANVAGGLAVSLENLKSLGQFVGSQLGVVTPILLALMIYALVRTARRDAFSFWFAAPILAGFVLKSIQGKVQANWALAGYVTGFTAFAAYYMAEFHALKAWVRTAVIAALATAALITVAAHFPGLAAAAGVPAERDPAKKVRGWQELGRQVSRLDASMERPRFIFSNHYMTAAELAFYVDGHPTTYCVNLGRRMNQYDLWPGFYDFAGYNALYVASGPMPQRLAGRFERVVEEPIIVCDRRGREIRKFLAYRCYGFKGMTAAKPKTY